MKSMRIALVLTSMLAMTAPAFAGPIINRIHLPSELDRLNKRLAGKVIDYTNNHSGDHRIYSKCLDQKRDLYVYVPPGYNRNQLYPLVIYMHGFGQDEESFLKLVDLFDTAIAQGKHPPVIIAAPDGSINGNPALLSAGSFYVNSKAGRFEDYMMIDVWFFVHRNFPIRPEREAHAFVGGSMGGFGTFNLGFKYKHRVGVLAGFLPPLNLRFLDCEGNYFGDFDPNCFQWRTTVEPWAPLARFAGGLVTIRQRRLVVPLYGRAEDALRILAKENPVEMLETYDIRPGEYEMFIAYAGKDEFNIDAQVESFLYFAKLRGLCVTSVLKPDGKHRTATGKELVPYMLNWMGPKLAPYAPPCQVYRR